MQKYINCLQPIFSTETLLLAFSLFLHHHDISRGAPNAASMAAGMVNMIPKNVQQQVAQEVGKNVAKGMVNSFFNK